MADRISQFREALGAADSYLHTLDMMVDALLAKGDNADYCAFLLIIEDAKKKVLDAQLLVDEMEGDEC